MKFHHALTQTRTSHYDLEIERGRYSKVPRHHRLYKVCLKEARDEYYFVLHCHMYDDLRSMYLPNKFYCTPHLHKFNLRMSSQSTRIIQSLQMFLFPAFKRCSKLLNQNSKNGLKWCVVYICILCMYCFIMGRRSKSE